jgi:hypothetical protein
MKLMKFTIEVLRIGDGSVEVLYRTEFQALGPKWVKTRAQELLNAWKQRSANGARVVNQVGQQVYYWRED